MCVFAKNLVVMGMRCGWLLCLPDMITQVIDLVSMEIMRMRFTGVIQILCVGLVLPVWNVSALTPERAEAWEQDLRFYLQQGEQNHINFYHSIDKAVLNAELNGLIKRLPDLNEYEVLAELLRIARLIGDGHSAIYLWSQNFRQLPMWLVDYRLDDRNTFRILETSKEYQHLLGNKLIGINGYDINAVVDRLASIVQYVENQHSIAFRTQETVVNVELLAGLGIIDDVNQVELLLENDQGSTTSVKVKTQARKDYLTSEKSLFRSPNISAFNEPGFIQNDGLWLGTDMKTKTAYIYFAWYPDFEDMMAFADKANDFIREHKIEHLIIDLRNNAGGDFFVGLILASGLLMSDSLDWSDGVYTLIGNKVFSASMSNATHYRQILNARLIGSPTGANPVGYQETHNLTLPNSEIPFTFSKRLYRFQDQQSDGVRPDVEVVNRWEDFKAGKDRVIEWVLEDIAESSP